MVIANQGENFSVGANLMLVLLAAQEGEWDELDAAVRRFQQREHGDEVRAEAGGGGAVRHGARRRLRDCVCTAARAQASAETYMGLVETGVGLIPAGGGCKEMLLRLGSAKEAFELIGYAKVSTSAEDAREMGLLPSAGRSLDEPGAADRRRQSARRCRWRRTTRPARRGRTSRWRARPDTRC